MLAQKIQTHKEGPILGVEKNMSKLVSSVIDLKSIKLDLCLSFFSCFCREKDKRKRQKTVKDLSKRYSQ